MYSGIIHFTSFTNIVNINILRISSCDFLSESVWVWTAIPILHNENALNFFQGVCIWVNLFRQFSHGQAMTPPGLFDFNKRNSFSHQVTATLRFLNQQVNLSCSQFKATSSQLSIPKWIQEKSPFPMRNSDCGFKTPFSSPLNSWCRSGPGKKTTAFLGVTA